MSSFFAGCLPHDETPACISSWFGVPLGGSQQTGVTARAGSGTHRAPGSEEDSLNPGSEEKEEEQPRTRARTADRAPLPHPCAAPIPAQLSARRTALPLPCCFNSTLGKVFD